ncbi:MAG: type 4a pilus biogenesis protein PilO [Thermoanaerobaculaceae bacterium]|jgi:Tfp pilus assembly protein PilO|nr:type 4a pilus biogenesis protein PilO [Thermoanaerobaculaceae bacterium]
MANLELTNKPWYYGAIIGVLLAGGIFWGMQRLVFEDLQKDIVNSTAELEKLKEKVRQGKMAENRLPQFREEAQRLETELQRLLRILPTARQTDELIKKVKSLTERAAFRLLTFQPGAFTKRDFLSEWPITVNMEGSYHELALFFDRLSRFSRIINVDSMTVNALAGKRGGFSISTSFIMKTFIYGSVQQPGGAQ